MAPGLSVIVNAVEHARMIFERMNSYAIYRIVETVRIMLFVVAAMIAFNFYPITAIMIILLAFFNDVPIMTISVDNTWLDPKPVRWNMRRVLTLATVLGLVGVIETFGLLVIARDGLHLGIPQIQSLIFLKLVVAGHMTLFVVRSRRHFFRRPWPSPWLIGALFSGEILATLFVVHPSTTLVRCGHRLGLCPGVGAGGGLGQDGRLPAYRFLASQSSEFPADRAADAARTGLIH
jgi:H+-transporting ATPase